MGAGASTGSGGPPANGGAGPPPPRRSGKSSSIGAKLALAAKEGDKEKVETLLGMAGSDPNAMDPTTGNTALHFAAAMGHVSPFAFPTR
jgi:ankyrin repeat protein